MKFLIVGLGNIGDEYLGTRHNIGFEVVDYFAESGGGKYSVEKYGSVAKARYAGKQLVILKPSTYMNLSGQAVRYWMQKENIKQSQLLVITDDLSLPVAKLRIKNKGSDGGHNGLKDISKMLGNGNYSRLRFGVGNDYPRGMQVDYVLGRFPQSDRKEVEESINKAAIAIQLYVKNGIQFAMNKIN